MTFNSNVELEDPISWRVLQLNLNFLAQYALPTQADQLYDLFENYQRSGQQDLEDTGRTLIYESLISFMNRQGTNGKECLRKAICENAQIQHHEGIFAEVINVILTPGRVNDPFKSDYESGRIGVDCQSSYPQCAQGDSVFDRCFLDGSF